MEKMKQIMSCLTDSVQEQFENLAQADVQELGQAFDMMKDLAETMYHCQIVEAMESRESLSPEAYRKLAYSDGKMFYTETEHHGIMIEGKTGTDRMRTIEAYFGQVQQDVFGVLDTVNPEERTYIKQKLSNIITKI